MLLVILSEIFISHSATRRKYCMRIFIIPNAPNQELNTKWMSVRLWERSLLRAY